ncbi:YhgE/Pip domain-containing protein [Limosilactobacillus fermentum]|uniref:YhgE/Pip domain-containing protein n=1 Tax=Limosilactobacillus fermentum TaxID=1613 RepID=UPI000C1EF3F7|nr:YhgE/Pip domain-containing protein [Limosilactobacillus fermentum]MCT3443759.1 YhgE/Pip domain-containing protein [Limosilactobacillus fermentum]PJF05964.1 YhgE/Pip domain-containing protein [Limosilactobacillus fermentum]
MWEMIKAEFRHIRRNRLLLLSVIVICFIPFLYSIFFLKSVWDPYGSTQNLPVAVVNEDRAVKYQGQTLKVGAQLVQELRKNKQLKWEIVSKQTAKEGLAHRKYYTVVTIPKDFSKNAATVLDQSPKKMELKYETNGSLNYIGQVISEMAMTKLNQKIRAQVTQSYATTMIKLVKQVGTGFNQAASGAKQISTGMVTLNSGTNQFVAGVSTVNNGVQTLQAAVTPLASGASQLASGSTTLASGVNQYTSGVGLLAAGLTKLSANSAALNAGTATLASGVNQYTSGVDQLGSGLTTLKNNSASLRSGAASLNQGASQLSNGASQLNATVNSSLGSLDFTGIMSAMNQASQMKSSLASLQSGLTQAQSALSAVSTEANQLKTASSALSGVSSAAQNDAAIAQSAAALAKSTTDATTKDQLDTIAQKAQSNVTTIQGLSSTLSQVNSLSTSLQSQLNNLPSLQTTLSGAQTTLNQANQLLTTLQGYQGALSAMPSQLAALKQATNSLASGAASLQSGMSTAQAGINQYTAGVDTAASGASQLSANSASLTNGANQLQSGVSQYTAGVNQANAGTGQLTANSAALVSGANQLATALIQLNAKVPSLVSGVSALASGTQKLVDNSPALVAGTAKLNAGAGELADKLISGAEKVNAVQPSKKAAKMFAAPTTVKHTNYSYVPNYGHALAPYVLSVALYVGALIFNFVYPIRRVALFGRKASAWWASKLAVGMTSVTVMALAEGGIMMLLGLQVLHVPSFFWTLILFGWASMAVVMFLSMTFDNPGRFVAMVLLMLQLGGSGGTFPMQVTMKFYNVIHWYLPMTYSILGLRDGISGGLGAHYVAFCNSVLLAITIVFVILLLVSMIYLQRHHYAGKSELDNNQELLGPEADDDGMHLKDRQ